MDMSIFQSVLTDSFQGAQGIQRLSWLLHLFRPCFQEEERETILKSALSFRRVSIKVYVKKFLE